MAVAPEGLPMPPRDPLPEPWRAALEPKGVKSKRGLATKAGISPQTALRLIDGIGRPSVETVAAVADKLFSGDRDRVWELAGLSAQDHGDWQLPPEASLLDQDQREAVLAVVRAMLPAHARHLTERAADKQDRRDATEPTVAEVIKLQQREVTRLRAVAADGDPNDAEVVEALAKLERFEQTGSFL